LHEAKINNNAEVIIWGSGKPRREFLYVDDMARACLHVLDLDKSIYNQYTQPMCSHINIGFGSDITIEELAMSIASVVGYNGKLKFDTTKPDGPSRKLVDITRLNNLGWNAKVTLNDGLENTYRSYLNHIKT
jgi:GDP-L-fucose synthase